MVSRERSYLAITNQRLKGKGGKDIVKASIAMCLYNGEKYIIEQLESIIRQTVQPYKVLICDDGSTDKGPELVKSFIEDNSLEKQWTFQKNKENKGYAKNFLEAAQSVDGEIIFFCDQDDIWEANKIEVMSKMMELNPTLNLLCSNLEPFYCEEDTVHWDPKVLKSMKNDGSIAFYSITPKNIHLMRSGCTMCVRKNFLIEIMPYWTGNWAHDDFVWKFSVLTGSCAILQFCSIKRRMHSKNATAIRSRSREWRIKQLHEFKEQYDSLQKYAEEVGICEEDMKIIKKNKKAIDLRLELIEKKRFWAWLELFCNYKDCYPRIKGLYLDGFLLFFDKYNGVN